MMYVTVAILAQGTHWAVATSQAFLEQPVLFESRYHTSVTRYAPRTTIFAPGVRISMWRHRKNLFEMLQTRFGFDQSKTVCPSGLRGWTQVPLAQAAWVQIPQLSYTIPPRLTRFGQRAKLNAFHSL